MKQYINEAKRMQFLAGIINESQLSELNDAEKDVVDAILGEGINEGKFNPGEILSKLVSAAKKGLLTAAILSSVLTSCNFDTYTEDNIKDELEKIEWSKSQVDSAELAKFKDENLGRYEQALKGVKVEKDSTLSKLKAALEPEGFQYVPEKHAFVKIDNNTKSLSDIDINNLPEQNNWATIVRVANPTTFAVFRVKYKDWGSKIPTNKFIQFIKTPEEAIKAAITNANQQATDPNYDLWSDRPIY